MDVPPGNEGSDAPQLPSPLSGVAPARHDPGRRRRRHRARPRRPTGPGACGSVLRDFDRRYATYVDVALAVVLFVLCSGWLFNAHAGASESSGWWPH